MRKLIIIMILLGIILGGMIVYQKNTIKNNQITVQEIEKIENYINQIYMWKEVTKEALPCFEDINQADETWIWEVVKKNLEEDEPSYQVIQKKAKELFGRDFTKEFPKEGTKSLSYNQEKNAYIAETVELDQQSDLFLLNKIDKIKNGYEVDIIEYLEDYSPMLKEQPEDFVKIKNLEEEEIGKISGSAEEEETEFVKKNVEHFTKKKITLELEDEKLVIRKVDTIE